MKMIRIILKIIMWVLIGGFLTNFILRNVSYSFYKGNKQKENVNVIPEKVNYTDTLTGYAYHLDKESDSIILCFGGHFIPHTTPSAFLPRTSMSPSLQ